MAVIVGDGRLTLTGYVGESSLVFDGWTVFDGFTHGEVLAALGEFDDDEPIVVHINSGGGYVTDGAAIRSALAEREGRTDVFVQGIAASAASLIAMAGETVTMATDAIMMIHDPSTITLGTAADHEASIRQLNNAASAMARSYSRKSGKSVADCRAIMTAETWFDAGEAVEAGFADEVEGEAEPVAAFPYQSYAHAPRELVALAKENGWRAPVVRSAATAATKAATSAAEPRRQEENSMTDKERADQLAAELKSLKAQIDSGKNADETAALQEELKTLRAEKDARANTDAIMALEEAKGREAQAKALADAGVKAEDAKTILAAAPKAEEPKPDPKAEYDAGRTAAAKGAGLGDNPKPNERKGGLLAMAKSRYQTKEA